MAGLDRVRQQGKKLGRPKVSPKIEDAIRRHLSAGNGILKVAAMVGVRKWHRAASEAGDDREVGDGFSGVIFPSFLDRSDRPVPHHSRR